MALNSARIADRAVVEPYGTASQQREGAVMSMYIFLGGDIMLFGGIFVVAWVLRFADCSEPSQNWHFSVLNDAVTVRDRPRASGGLGYTVGTRGRPGAMTTRLPTVRA